MTVIVTVECPDQPVKVLVRECYPPMQSDTPNWVYRNEKATFSVYDGKTLAIEEWPEDKRPSDDTDVRLRDRLANGASEDTSA
jgi:hypothetical protein